jgi:hypothetical protein
MGFGCPFIEGRAPYPATLVFFCIARALDLALFWRSSSANRTVGADDLLPCFLIDLEGFRLGFKLDGFESASAEVHEDATLVSWLTDEFEETGVLLSLTLRREKLMKETISLSSLSPFNSILLENWTWTSFTADWCDFGACAS